MDAHNIPDETLLARTMLGDKQAFALLSKRYAGAAHRIAQRLLVNSAEADDAVQEAMTRLWLHAKDWHPERGSFSSWFGGIVVHASLDQARTRKRQAIVADSHTVIATLLSENDESDALCDLAQQSTAIQKALAHLPEQQRRAVDLCYLQEYSNPQAAKVMNMPVKALEGLLFRARKQLRHWLGRLR